MQQYFISRDKSALIRIYSLSACISLFVLATLLWAPFNKNLFNNIELPSYYWIREKLQLKPTLDKRIKIYAIDDRVTNFVQSHELDLKLWAKLIKLIDAKQPQAIIIDKMFYFPDRIEENNTYFIESLKSLKSTLVVAAALYQNPAGSLTQDLNRAQWKVSEFVEGESKLPQWIEKKQGYLYGPHPIFNEIPWRIGHINYELDGLFDPFIAIAPQTLVPLLVLHAFDESPKLDKSNFTLMGQSIVLSNSKILINQLPQSDLIERTGSLIGLIRRAIDNVAIPDSEITQKDYVVIIPEFYTGNSDQVQTSLGPYNGTFLLANVLNSVLTKQWIYKPHKFWSMLIGLFYFLICGICAYLNRKLAFGIIESALGLLFFSSIFFVFIKFGWVLFPVILGFSFFVFVLGLLTVRFYILKKDTLSDFLTQTYNRRMFDEVLLKEWSRICRSQVSDRSVIILDLDHFKSVNDNYGHPAGDLVLVEVSKRLKHVIRSADVLARLGGEEFALIASTINLEQLKILCERIRLSIESEPVVWQTKKIYITVSIGASQIDPTRDTVYDEVYRRADKSLYGAKNSGRNKAIIN